MRSISTLSGEANCMLISTDTLRVVDLGPHLLGFYDGRVAGRRAFSAEANWLDDGGYTLGICSYAIYCGHHALVYDTHLSVAHARRIRDILSQRGIETFRVVLSHWHLDHIAGNAAFADCEIIASDATVELLQHNKALIEAGNLDGAPPIFPLIMPTRSFSGETTLDVGGVRVDLKPLDIHSRDGVTLFLPHDGTLLAGDTLEDTITYVDEPHRLTVHLRDLERMREWSFSRILPNHGALERITGGGYDASLITATSDYVERLLRAAGNPAPQPGDLKHFIAEHLSAGAVTYFAPYEAIHRGNLDKVATALG